MLPAMKVLDDSEMRIELAGNVSIWACEVEAPEGAREDEVSVYVYMYICINVCMHITVYVYTYFHVCIRGYMCIDIYIYMLLYIQICAHVCIHINM